MTHGFKTSNYYAQQLGPLFEECPKAVLAAIAVSALTCGGDWLEHAAGRVAQEWCILHANGIVQKPSLLARKLAAAEEAQIGGAA